MSLSTDFKEAVVIDNGSTLCKAGFAGYDGPNAVFVNKVGRPKNSYSGVIDTNLEHAVVGDETYPNRFYLSLTRPMEHGIVTHWNDMEKLWDYTFHEVLRVQPKEQPVLLTEVSLNSKVEKERMVEIMFEKFEVPAMNVANTTVLSLFCSGRTTGCVVDSGGGASRTACVFEGQILPQSVQRIEVDGCDLTDYLARLMEYRGFLFTTVPEMKIVKDMKEKLTYVSLDFDPTTTIHDLIYELPDGSRVSIGSERFQCPEALFQPALAYKGEANGIHEATYISISECEEDLQQQMLGNIIFAGGNTMFPGIAERLAKELTRLVPPTMNVKVVAPPERNHSAWIGGSILASLSTFQQLWITKAQYEENGISIVESKSLH